MTNPPYGVRVGESGRVRDLWAQLGKVLRARAPGWQVALLSPDQALERQLVLPADGDAVLVVPRLEAPRVVEQPDIGARRTS